MRKHMKLLAAFLTAVIMLSSISMLVSAVEVIDFGQVDIVNTRCSYTWEYLDNDVLKIKPTDRDIYLDKCFFTDYMQTAFTSDTQIIIDLSNLTNATSLNLYGSGCPSGELVFTGNNVENIKIIEFINFNDLHSVSLKNGFSIIVDIVSCGVTSVDIFRGGEISTLYVADCNNLEEVVIPDNINNFQISTCRNVVSLDIPDSLKGLSANTLPKLESFDIPETLKSCSLFQVNFTDVFVPNTLEYFTISHALDLESATVEEGSTRLFSSMFTECYGLQNVNIPYGVTTIEYNAFNGCTSLSTVELPDSVNKIYSNAFRRSGIRYIDLPRGITAIEYGTFAQCTNLQAITIPHSVTKIDDSAFVDCYSLDDIYFDGSRSQWESITVYNHLADSVSEMSLEDLFPNVNMHFNTFIYKGPEDFTGPVGSNAEFSVVADGDPNDFTYQWMYFKNGVWADFDVESATTPNLTFPITEDLDGIFVHCAVKDNEGMTLVSTEAKLTVKGKTAKIVGYPSSATNCIVGDIEIFMVSAEGDGLKYQWQVLKPGAEAWVNCSINDGAKTATLEIEVKESRNGCQYKCVVTDKYGNTVETDPVSLTIGTSLEIIEQPECYEGYLGEYAIFNVVAQGEGLKYQWQVEKDGWVNCSVKDGAKTDTLTLLIKESRDGQVYRCVITDKYGATVTSEEAMLGVDTDLKIVEEPTDFSGTVGQTAKFIVEAKGEGLKYQWQVLKKGSWTNCSINDGARTNTLSQEIKESRDGYVYRCVITDKYGDTKTTDEVTLSISHEIYIAAEPEYCYGKTGDYATFTVEAEGDGLKYQWQVWKNGAWINCSINDGARTDTLKLLIKESRDGSKYQCVITDKYGNLATTREVILFVEIAEAKAVNPDFAVVDADAAVIEEATVETIESTDAVVTEDVAEVSEVFEVAEVIETEAVTEAD